MIRQILDAILATCDFERVRTDVLVYMDRAEAMRLSEPTAARVDRFILAVENGLYLNRVVEDKTAMVILLSNIDVVRMCRLLDAVERHVPGYTQRLRASPAAELPQANRFQDRIDYLVKIQRVCRLYRNRFRILALLNEQGNGRALH